jgi:hypothetical protein
MDVGPSVEVNTIAPYLNRRIGDARPASPFAHDLFPCTRNYRATGVVSPVPGSPA